MSWNWRQWWYDPAEVANLVDVLPLTRAQYGAVVRAVVTWLLIRQEAKGGAYVGIGDAATADRITNGLIADLLHSALLPRMLVDGKPPLLEPPPLEQNFPMYPD